MLSPRMSMLPLPPSRPSAPSNLWTGVPLVSKLVSTTNLPLLCPVVTSPRSNVPSACCPTPLPLLRLGLVLTTSFKVGINYQPPTVVPGGDLAKVQRAQQ